MNLYPITSIFIILSIYVEHGFACDGYKLKLKKIENCGGSNQVISIDQNFTSTITRNCEVVTNGCVTSIGFKEAKVKYTISKNGIIMMSGNPDLCEELDNNKNEEASAKLKMFGLPTDCPIPEGRRCADPSTKLDFTRYKKFLSLARGKMEVKTDITHDTGNTCLKIAFEIYK